MEWNDSKLLRKQFKIKIEGQIIIQTTTKKTPAKTRKNSILRTKKKVTQKGLVKESQIRHRKGVACQKQKGRLVKTNEIMSNYLLNIYFVH